LKADLENVATARNLLTAETASSKALNEQRRVGVLSLYELLPNKTLNPATQVTKAISLTNNTPFVSLNDLWSYVDGIPEAGFSVTKGVNKGATYSKKELVNGFRRSIMDSIFNRAGDKGQIFDVENAFRTMFEPHPNSPADVVLSEWMVSKGIMTKPEVERTRKLLGRMAQIQAFSAKAKPGDIEAFAKEVGPLFQLATRISGSELGATMQSAVSGSGQSLIARQAGSSYAQSVAGKYLSELPASLRMDVIQTIVDDPQLLAQVLRRGLKGEEASRVEATILQNLMDNGVLASFRRAIPPAESLVTEGDGLQDIKKNVTEKVKEILPPNDQQGTLIPTQRAPTPKVGPAPLSSQQASAAPGPSIQNSGPVDRERFAALFPNDSTTQLMKSGIGSLA